MGGGVAFEDVGGEEESACFHPMEVCERQEIGEKLTLEDPISLHLWKEVVGCRC